MILGKKHPSHMQKQHNQLSPLQNQFDVHQINPKTKRVVNSCLTQLFVLQPSKYLLESAE
jgi:hypothetical protein